MTDSIEEDFFTPKHERLARIASVANAVAWIALVVQIVLVGARFIEVQNSYLIQTRILGQNSDFMAMLRGDILYTLSLIVDFISIFLRGIIYWLVLRGISLGLNMIVETDLNYREKIQEESHEQ